jgi:hypothetical protein
MTTAVFLAQASRRIASRSTSTCFSKTQPTKFNTLLKPCKISSHGIRHSSALAAAFATRGGDSTDPKSLIHPWPKIVALLAGTAVVGNAFNEHKNKTDCCGIAGVIGTTNHDAR